MFKSFITQTENSYAVKFFKNNLPSIEQKSILEDRGLSLDNFEFYFM